MYSFNNLYDKIGVSKPIVLVGMMGAGKTTIGLRLAKKLSLPFIDTDEMISKMVGCSISDILKYQSEEYFREKEYEAINTALQITPSIIATGGGAFVNEKVMNEVLENGIAVWLRAPLDVLVERVSRKNTRPLLEQGDKQEILEKQMQEQYAKYENAHIIVDSDILTHYHVVNDIVTKLKQYSLKHI